MVYGSLLNKDLSDELEKLQKVALKLIKGLKVSYEKALKKAGIEILSPRRIKSLERFALKVQNSERFSKDWLKQNDKNGRDLRRIEKYKVQYSKFDRLRNGPLNCLRKFLNNCAS